MIKYTIETKNKLVQLVMPPKKTGTRKKKEKMKAAQAVSLDIKNLMIRKKRQLLE